MIDAIPVLAWTAKPDGAIDYFNVQWLEFTGLPAHQALDWGWMAAAHEDDRERVGAAWAAAIASGQPVEVEIRLRRADGVWVWFLARARALRDDSGRVLKWYGTNTEIEDRRRSEQALRDSELNFRDIIDSVPGLLFTVTPEGEVESVNRQLLEFFGVDLADLRQWRQAEHVHPEDLANTANEVGLGLASGQPFSFEQRLRRVDGVYRRFRFRAAPLLDAAGKVVRWYGVLVDLEDQIASEAELVRARSKLARAMEVAAVSEVAAAIAQQISEPLQQLVQDAASCRESLTADEPKVADALRHSRSIGRYAHDVAEKVTRIRALFRRESSHREPLNLNALLQEVLALVADELRTVGTSLVLQLDPMLSPVMADRSQMQQVVLNLAHGVRDSFAAMGLPASVMRIESS